MKSAKAFFLTLAIALAPFPWFLPAIGEAQCIVNGVPGTIQDAINAAFPGATIFVTGTCNENNIFIGPQKSNIRLNGQPDPALPRATIFSRNDPETAFLDSAPLVSGATDVRIRNFIITSDGTSDGVSITDGATVRLENNIIENMLREGVFVRFSHARIFDNTIQNNGGDGIVVTEGSSVRIGFSSTDDGVVRPNTIQGNAGNGISVIRSSTARIVGNASISGNGGHAISVTKASHADIAASEVSGNGGDGISVTGNSGVNLGSAASGGIQIPPLAPIFTEPNSTTALNSGFGVRCSVGGYAIGDLGTLNGVLGATSFEKSCIDGLPTKK